MMSQSISSSPSGWNRQDPEFQLITSKGVTPVTALQLRVESCEYRRKQQSQSCGIPCFFSMLKHIIRDLGDDVVSIYNFGNCYNLPYTATTSSPPKSAHLVRCWHSSLNRNVPLLQDLLKGFCC